MITVAGISPSLDLMYLVDALRLGEIHRPTSVVRCAGGKSLNMARAATTVGAQVNVVAVLGGQTGAGLAESLTEQGIQVSVVDSPTETRTCVSISSGDSDELTEIYEYAASIPPEVWSRFETEIENTVADRPGWLAISGGAPRGLDPSALGDLIRLGQRLGAQVAVDTHSEALVEAVNAAPALVKINRHEAAGLLEVPDETDLAEMAASIRERTAGRVVLTDGEAGALGLDENGVARVAMPDIRGRFPVGSGDSFLGGLLAILDNGGTMAEALHTATACGIANALVPGPARFELASVESIRAELSPISG